MFLNLGFFLAKIHICRFDKSDRNIWKKKHLKVISFCPNIELHIYFTNHNCFCFQLTKISFIFKELNANDLLDILQALMIFNLFCVKTCFWRVHFLNSHQTIQCTLARQAIFLGHPVCCHTEEYFTIFIHIQSDFRKENRFLLKA